ncbi:MAG: GNAT family N-acetyltransferase [Nocardioidaceae bacterium]
MAEITVRVLDEEDWQTLRQLRLAALEDAPEAFAAHYEEESQYGEEVWRKRLRRARRLLADHDGEPAGIVSMGTHDEDSTEPELFGLWVDPRSRRERVAWQLVQAGADQALRDGHERLYFWVGSDNGGAVAFASIFGFRPTSERRPMRAADDTDSEDETAMVLALTEDPRSVHNPLLP